MMERNRQKNILKQKSLTSNDPKRKLFLGAIMGGLGDAAGAVTGGVGDLVGGAGEAVGGASPGAVLGVGAAGAGLAARKARKDKFHFDKTQLELGINFEEFRKQYIDFEYSNLRECIRETSRINGNLSSMEKNLVYRVNNRILEMVDAM